MEGCKRRVLFPSAAVDDVLAAVSNAYPPSGTVVQPEPESRNNNPDDVLCPLSDILNGASERAKEMVDNLQRFTANEDIEHTEFRKNGKPRKASNQLFS